MNATYFETIIPVPNKIGIDKYEQHRWLSGFLRIRDKYGIEHQFVSMHPDLPAINFRTHEAVESNSIQQVVTIEPGMNATFTIQLCVSQSRSQRSEDGTIIRRVNTFPSASSINSYVTKKLDEQSGINGEIKCISKLTMANFHKHRKKFAIPYVDVVFSGTVDQPGTYKTAIETGIGKKRSLGFGMLRVLPNE